MIKTLLSKLVTLYMHFHNALCAGKKEIVKSWKGGITVKLRPVDYRVATPGRSKGIKNAFPGPTFI